MFPPNLSWLLLLCLSDWKRTDQLEDGNSIANRCFGSIIAEMHKYKYWQLHLAFVCTDSTQTYELRLSFRVCSLCFNQLQPTSETGTALFLFRLQNKVLWDDFCCHCKIKLNWTGTVAFSYCFLLAGRIPKDKPSHTVFPLVSTWCQLWVDVPGSEWLLSAFFYLKKYSQGQSVPRTGLWQQSLGGAACIFPKGCTRNWDCCGEPHR